MKSHNKTFLICFLLLTIVVTYPISSSAQVGVSPRLLELNNEAINKTHAFRLFNFSKKDTEVEVEISNWTMDEVNKIKIIASDHNSLDQWTIVNPLRFKINAGSSQTIRLAFRLPVDAAPGEYRTMLYFNQILKDDDPSKDQVKSKFRIGAAVYLQIGEKKPIIKVNKVNIDEGYITLEASNMGNTHVRFNGYWALWSQQPNDTAFSLMINEYNKNQDSQLISGLIAYDKMPTTPLLPQHTRTYRIKKPQELITDENLIFQFIGEISEFKQLITIPVSQQNNPPPVQQPQ